VRGGNVTSALARNGGWAWTNWTAIGPSPTAERSLRRAAIHHALLSYLFGAVMFAIAVSSGASLIGR
jgi:hypothetical protein